LREEKKLLFYDPLFYYPLPSLKIGSALATKLSSFCRNSSPITDKKIKEACGSSVESRFVLRSHVAGEYVGR
jgi:hypothetical protein